MIFLADYILTHNMATAHYGNSSQLTQLTKLNIPSLVDKTNLPFTIQKWTT